MRTPISHSVLALVALLTAGGQPAFALTADVSVKTQLSERVTEVGSTVQIEVQVSGGESDEGPPDIKVDGLDIQYAGPSHSTRIQYENGRVNREVDTTYVYQVTPEKEGDYTIPALPVKVGGRAYKTQPVGLKVQKNGTVGANGGDQGGAIGFAEIQVEKKTAYVGELVPVEVKLFIRSGVRAEIGTAPDLTGDGFTIQKTQQPRQDRAERDGTEYTEVTYETVMTPTKAGKLTIGPSEIPFVAQVPRARRNRPRSLGESLFGDDFFDPFGGFAERRRFNAKAPAVELDVKPLPSEGRPKTFSGAVGQFTFDAEGSPTHLKVGDPVTMRLKVSGRGNFDRIALPTMIDATGWQAYDSSERFDPRDELKTAGTKTFELPIVPESAHRETPVFAFSYFDPNAAKYVTVRSKPQSLVIDGAPVAQAPAPKPEAEPVAEPNPQPNSAPPTPVDLAGLRYEPGVVGAFAPLYARREFWMIQGAPALGLFGFMVARVFRKDPRKRRVAILEHQRNELWKRLRAHKDTGHFWEHAARLVQVDTAIKADVEADSVDATLVKHARKPDPELEASIDEIFERRDALLFAGAGVTRSDVPAEQRAKAVTALEKLCRR